LQETVKANVKFYDGHYAQVTWCFASHQIRRKFVTALLLRSADWEMVSAHSWHFGTPVLAPWSHE
jgi:hypothetical protein